ncbi:hypothetical protein GCM10010191_93240 [Actinomadura vinacea]|uniref:Phosphatidate cytidylyltransferase n=1 Tax=Actinomadura vinacea TaxID=115336 RepID=A0ABN3KG73_9ACTN
MNARNARGGSAGGASGGRPPERRPGLRAAVEASSAAPLVFLSRMPRWALLAVVFGLLVIGMAGSGWVGASGLLVLWVLLAWFAYLNWPELELSGRLLRLAALAVLAAFAVAHLP